MKINEILVQYLYSAILKPLKRKEVITMPRTKGSKNKPKVANDYASRIAENPLLSEKEEMVLERSAGRRCYEWIASIRLAAM